MQEKSEKNTILSPKDLHNSKILCTFAAAKKKKSNT